MAYLKPKANVIKVGRPTGPKCILLLADQGTIDVIKNGVRPHTPYSHDRNVFHLGHEALRLRQRVLIGRRRGPYASQAYLEVNKVYPRWQLRDSNPCSRQSFEPDVVIGVHPQDLDVKKYFPTALIVGVNPALGFVEYPTYYRIEKNGKFVGSDLVSALQSSIDYVTVQNPRMKELTSIMYDVLASWRHDDRILIAPFGYVKEEHDDHFDRDSMRQEMGLTPSDIAIISSGGIWRWTDFNSFLSAFVQVAREGASNLKLFIMGFSQPDNFDHKDYIKETKKILSNNSGFVGKNIIVFDDWKKASSVVQRYTRAADIGINSNKESLENWQSHRVRFIEYMRYGLPVINTVGDYLSDNVALDAVFTVRPGDIDGYVGILRNISRSPELVVEKQIAMRRIAQGYQSDRTTGELISFLLTAKPLTRADLKSADNVTVSSNKVLNPLRRRLYGMISRVYYKARASSKLAPLAMRLVQIDWLRRRVRSLERNA
jgi:glycosyltransferase involved in cell wall biosynthesis